VRQVVGWLQLGAAVILFTAFLVYIAVTYAAVAAYEAVVGR
jgi:archaellum component FlaF (FlaF/FlaG flagellin family)